MIIKNSAMKALFLNSVVAFVFVFACSLRLLTTFYARALIIFLFAKVSQNTGFCATAFESFKSTVQRFIFLNVNFRHLFPSLHALMALKGPFNLAFSNRIITAVTSIVNH